jgi:hypothetical protein
MLYRKLARLMKGNFSLNYANDFENNLIVGRWRLLVKLAHLPKRTAVILVEILANLS